MSPLGFPSIRLRHGVLSCELLSIFYITSVSVCLWFTETNYELNVKYHEINVCPMNPLLFVLFLFVLKNMLVEVVLEMLVRVVDAELLKAVVCLLSALFFV